MLSDLLKRTFNILIQEHELHIIYRKLKRQEKYKTKLIASTKETNNLIEKFIKKYNKENENV